MAGDSQIAPTTLRMTPFLMVHIIIRPLADTTIVNCQLSILNY